MWSILHIQPLKMELTEGSEMSAKLQSDAGEIPKKRTYRTFKTRRKFEIKNNIKLPVICKGPLQSHHSCNFLPIQTLHSLKIWKLLLNNYNINQSSNQSGHPCHSYLCWSTQTCIEVKFCHLQRIHFTLLFTKTKDDDRSKLSFHYHFYNFEDVWIATSTVSSSSASLITLCSITSILEHCHGCVEIVFFKLTLINMTCGEWQENRQQAMKYKTWQTCSSQPLCSNTLTLPLHTQAQHFHQTAYTDYASKCTVISYQLSHITKLPGRVETSGLKILKQVLLPALKCLPHVNINISMSVFISEPKPCVLLVPVAARSKA